MDKRKPEYVFIQNPDLYFVTAQDGNVKPYIKFDLGKNIIFNPTELLFDSRASFKDTQIKSKDNKNNIKDKRGHVSKLNATLGQNSDRVNISAKLRKPFSTARFELMETDKGSGCDIFRLTTLELFGKFE